MDDLKQSQDSLPSEDPNNSATALLVVGILIVVLSSAALAFFLYSKITHGS